MESSIRHVAESRAEDVGTPVRLQVIPDLETPYDMHVRLQWVAIQTATTYITAKEYLGSLTRS